MKADKKMPDEFYDWLENCPVQWFREKVEENSIHYEFVVEDENKE